MPEQSTRDRRKRGTALTHGGARPGGGRPRLADPPTPITVRPEGWVARKIKAEAEAAGVSVQSLGGELLGEAARVRGWEPEGNAKPPTSSSEP